MKERQKGFTLVEVIVTFVLVATISFLLFQLVLSMKNIYTSSDYKTVLLIEQGNMTRRMNDDFFDMRLLGIDACTEAQKTSSDSKMCLVFTLEDSVMNEEVTRKLEVMENKIVYDSYTMNIKNGSKIGDVSAVVAKADDISIKYNSILTIDIPVTNKLTDGDFGIHIVYQYNSLFAEIDEEALNEVSEIKFTSLTVPDIAQNTVNSGEGLYNVTEELWYKGEKDAPKFVFKGINPNNYVIFNKKCYRIMNITNDYMMKLVYEGEAANNSTCTASTTTGTIGKNAWGSPNNNWLATTTTLRNTKLPNWLTNQQANENRVSSNANSYIGAVNSNGEDLKVLFEQMMTSKGSSSLTEKSAYLDHEYSVTLPMVSDYILASLDTSCNSIATAISSDVCGNKNYMAKNYSYWTLNANGDGTLNAWAVGSDRKFVSTTITTSLDTRPVIFLKETTRFEGEGKASNPYIVK